MDETKYGKYIVTELKQSIPATPWHPPVAPAGKGKGGRIMYLDNEVVPGAFYVDCVWIIPAPEVSDDSKTGGIKGRKEIGPHSHDYDEVIAFFGTDLNNPNDLCAEVELWLDDEKHIITKTSLVFVPKGLQHCPLRFNRLDRPVFHFSTAAMKMYY